MACRYRFRAWFSSALPPLAELMIEPLGEKLLRPPGLGRHTDQPGQQED